MQIVFAIAVYDKQACYDSQKMIEKFSINTKI